MLKITESKTFQEIEAGITGGELVNAIKSLNSTAITEPNKVITTKNCKALKLFFEDRTTNKICPMKKEFEDALASGKIKLVHDSTSKLQTLIYAFPVLSNSKDTFLVLNATHFFTANEILTETGTSISYTVRDKNDAYLAEIANVAMFVLKCSDSTANINKHLNTKKEMMNLYSSMMVNVLAKQGTIGANKDNLKVLRYYTNCLFLKGVFGTQAPHEIYSGLAAHEADISADVKKNCDLKIQLSSNAATAFDNILEYIKFVKEIFPSIGPISLSNMINQYNIAYTPVAVLSIDYLPYLAGLYAATATKNIVFGGASFRNKIDVSPTSAIRSMNEL